MRHPLLAHSSESFLGDVPPLSHPVSMNMLGGFGGSGEEVAEALFHEAGGGATPETYGIAPPILDERIEEFG